MKKIIIAIICAFVAFGAYAENENAATSKEYVDAELAMKQPTISAQGNNVVMTFDSTTTDGIGTKQIYDESASYASQTDALVTAETANAAVQMAINGEFYCKEWSTLVENDCWLWGIREPTPHSASKNLLDQSFMDNSTYDTVTVYGVTTNYAKILPTENGKQYTLSASLIGNNAFNYHYYLRGIKPDGTLIGTYGFDGTCNGWLWNTEGHPEYLHQLLNVSCNFMAQDNVVYIVYFPGKSYTSRLTITNYQMEEGDTATAYEPYQNLYIPQNVQ